MHPKPPFCRRSSLAFRDRPPASCRGCRLGAVLLLTACPLSLLAQPVWAPQGLFLQGGGGEKVASLTVGVSTRPWQRSWDLLGGQLGGYWEASFSRWEVRESPTSQRYLNQFAVTPVFRWRPGEGSSPWFAEGAIGLTYTSSRYFNGGKYFSSRFNFGDHLALGRSFGAGQQHELALRVQHFSNAGLRKPNPGENFLQLRYAVRFD